MHRFPCWVVKFIGQGFKVIVALLFRFNLWFSACAGFRKVELLDRVIFLMRKRICRGGALALCFFNG